MSKLDFSTFVEHPRYGRGPRVTGLNPVPQTPRPGETYVHLHWHSSAESRIPNTAIEADVSRQNITTMGVTHYFDEIRTCRKCEERFIFFAVEQKYWYEKLGFSLEADCVQCVGCRKSRQALAAKRRRYEELCHSHDPSEADLLEMAECCLSLIEESLFSLSQTLHVRALLNRVPAKKSRKLRSRLLVVEALQANPKTQ